MVTILTRALGNPALDGHGPVHQSRGTTQTVTGQDQHGIGVVLDLGQDALQRRIIKGRHRVLQETTVNICAGREKLDGPDIKITAFPIRCLEFRPSEGDDIDVLAALTFFGQEILGIKLEKIAINYAAFFEIADRPAVFL